MANGNLSVFTPQMAAAGIQLIPAGSTQPLKPLGSQLTGDAPRNRVINAPIPETPLPFDRNQAQPVKVAPRGTITPDDVRPVNPFNPNLRVAPEDDALTPEGTLAPSEIASLGKALTGFGASLKTPGFAKALGVLGARIGGPGSVGEGLGQLAVSEAESRARSEFEQRLDAGERASDILIPGLSPEGRETVLGRRGEQAKEERIAGQEEQRIKQSDQRLQLEERAQSALQIERAIQRDLSEGRLNLQTAQEARLARQQELDEKQREFKNGLDQQIAEANKAYQEARIRLEEDPASNPDQLLDTVLRFNQTATIFEKSLEDEILNLSDAETAYQAAVNEEPGWIGRIVRSEDKIKAKEQATAAALKERDAAKERVETLRSSINALRQRSRNALLGLGVGEESDNPLASPETQTATGQNQGVVPTASATPSVFPSTAAARAAGKKTGDIVTIQANGITRTAPLK